MVHVRINKDKPPEKSPYFYHALVDQERKLSRDPFARTCNVGIIVGPPTLKGIYIIETFFIKVMV